MQVGAAIMSERPLDVEAELSVGAGEGCPVHGCGRPATHELAARFSGPGGPLELRRYCEPHSWAAHEYFCRSRRRSGRRPMLAPPRRIGKAGGGR